MGRKLRRHWFSSIFCHIAASAERRKKSPSDPRNSLRKGFQGTDAESGVGCGGGFFGIGLGKVQGLCWFHWGMVWKGHVMSMLIIHNKKFRHPINTPQPRSAQHGHTTHHPAPPTPPPRPLQAQAHVALGCAPLSLQKEEEATGQAVRARGQSRPMV